MHLDVAALRAAAHDRAASRPRGPELPAVGDLIVPDTPGVRARRYRPAIDAPRPLLVFLHGGLWVLGDLETHDRLCRRIAAEADVEVLAVDYRRAPEHRWPAAVDDALAAVRWAAESIRAPAIGIGGDSAGGCVAALAALALRDEGDATLVAQVLLCPNTDLTGAQPSMAEPASAAGGVDPEAVRAAARLWVPDVARHADGDVSPLHARDLSGLPPAVVITAGDDPLRDEGDAYAARLRDAGVDVVHRQEPGLPHGFMQSMDLVRADAAAATDRAIADVARALGE